MPLFLYDDARARTFEPFALTRPASELRAGAVLVRHRWESAIGERAAGLLVGGHLSEFEELDAPVAAREGLPAGSVVANSRCVLSLGGFPRDVEVWTCGRRVAAVRLAREMPAAAFDGGAVDLESLAGAGGESAEVGGRWLDEVWDLIRELSPQLTDDIMAIGPHLSVERPAHSVVLGEHPLYVERGADVEPQVCFDLSSGPVLVLAGATIRAFTRIVGPCAIAGGSSVAGDRVAASSIGDMCRVHGEVSNSVFLGHSNKSHDGFVGHSYFGRWTNLGAGTTTSNLKNTYGTVALWTPAGVRDTGMQFLGTLMGDHAKTGIGLRLTTGCVVGSGANVVDTMPPKVVPPFAWGNRAPYAEYDAGRFVDVAARVMARRHVELSERGRRALLAAYDARWRVDQR